MTAGPLNPPLSGLIQPPPTITSTAPSARSAHRTEIDGLRALAVLPVILFHAGVSTFSGGFVGVDIFFVISGFLIGRILITEIGSGIFSLVDFYERRARRILPALTVMLFSCAIFAWAWMPRSDFANFSMALLAVSVFASNIWFWRSTDYFAPDAESNPLVHTWTLSVEEQFYVFVPLLLMALLPRGRRLAFAVIGVGVMASLIISHWGAIAKPEPTFYLLPTRAWELGIGVLAAFVDCSSKPLPRNRFRDEALSDAGLFAIIAAIFTYDSQTPFPSLYTLLPTAGAAAILLFARHGTFCHWLFSRRPLVFVGLISYSAYLWHQPIFAFARIKGIEDGRSYLLLSALAISLAYISWRHIEAPFRDRRRIGRRAIFISSGVVTLALFTLAGLGLAMPNVQSDVYKSLLSPQEADNDRLIQRYAVANEAEILIDDGLCRFPFWQVDAAFRERFAKCRRIYGPALLVVGDSHAQNLFNAIVQEFPDAFVIGAVRGGCRPFKPSSQCIFEKVARLIASDPEAFRAIVYHQSGSYLMLDADGRPDSDASFEEGSTFSFDAEAFAAAADYLNGLGAQVPVVWVGPFGELRQRLQVPRLHEQTFQRTALARFDWLEARIATAMASRETSRFQYQPLHAALGPLYGPVIKGDCLMVRDKDHWSQCGESHLGNLIATHGLLANLPRVSRPGRERKIGRSSR